MREERAQREISLLCNILIKPLLPEWLVNHELSLNPAITKKTILYENIQSWPNHILIADPYRIRDTQGGEFSERRRAVPLLQLISYMQYQQHIHTHASHRLSSAITVVRLTNEIKKQKHYLPVPILASQ